MTAVAALERIRAHRYAIGGYACLFNTISVIAGVRELVKPGAFERALAARNWYLLGNHVVGRPSFASMHAGTLHVEEDPYGLWFEAQLPDDDGVGARLMDAVKRRTICGVSTGGCKQRVQQIQGNRVLIEAAVWEISLAIAPCQPQRVGTWVLPNSEAQRHRARLRRLAS